MPGDVPRVGWLNATQPLTCTLFDPDNSAVSQDEPVTVYNFQVQDWHTYFVSELQVLVHNTCALEGGSGAGKWTNPDGSVKWPPNNGAVQGTEKTVTLKPGEQFGRIGSDYGKYVAPPGTEPSKLSLAPGTNTSLYKEYTVVKEIPNVQQSVVAPWFGQPGGGIQKLLPYSIDELLQGGYIVLK